MDIVVFSCGFQMENTTLVVQINRWQDNHFGLLMPGQSFINGILKRS